MEKNSIITHIQSTRIPSILSLTGDREQPWIPSILSLTGDREQPCAILYSTIWCIGDICGTSKLRIYASQRKEILKGQLHEMGLWAAHYFQEEYLGSNFFGFDERKIDALLSSLHPFLLTNLVRIFQELNISVLEV
jgi:hypothetical protein